MSVVLRAGLWLIVTLLGTLIQASHSAKAACPPGYGSKPTPGGFGGWSCQPLGGGVPSGGGYRGAGGSTGGGSSGGGNNVGAAIGAAGIAIEILGAMADEAAQQEAAQQAADAATQAEAARRAAARQAFCLDNWRRAVVMIDRGKYSMLDADPQSAVAAFEQAIQYLSPCRDSRNIAVAQRNLDIVRHHAAALRDDNRVNDARRQFGVHDPSRAANPFAAQPTQPVVAQNTPPTLAADPRDIVANAEKSCSFSQPGSAVWKQCMTTQEARQILGADPDIKGSCGWIADAADRNKCAIDAFVKKVRLAAANPETCYFKQNGRPCFPGGGSARPAAETMESLRDRLRRKLNANRRAVGDTRPVTDDDVTAAVEAERRPTSNDPRPMPVVAGDYNRDDPLQNFLRSESATPGITNDGRMSQGRPEMTGLEPTPEQRRWMEEELKRTAPVETYGPPVPSGFQPWVVP